jgi:hypothetical protein
MMIHEEPLVLPYIVKETSRFRVNLSCFPFLSLSAVRFKEVPRTDPTLLIEIPKRSLSDGKGCSRRSPMDCFERHASSFVMPSAVGPRIHHLATPDDRRSRISNLDDRPTYTLYSQTHSLCFLTDSIQPFDPTLPSIEQHGRFQSLVIGAIHPGRICPRCRRRTIEADHFPHNH